MVKGISCLLGLLLLASCIPHGSGQVMEPRAFVVRNLSGVDLQTVTLAADKVAKGKSQRFGTISPVLNGTSQVTVRGTSAPALPQYVEISWVERSGREYRRSVDLLPILPQAKDIPTFSLDFEVHPAGGLRVFISAYP